ncbi:hypothetical protein AOLI_G00257400 [Acnodon oligacanthus]
MGGEGGAILPTRRERGQLCSLGLTATDGCSITSVLQAHSPTARPPQKQQEMMNIALMQLSAQYRLSWVTLSNETCSDDSCTPGLQD